jgi:hypothetical protein
MKIFCCVFALCLLRFAGAFAQADTNTYMVKYSRDFRFTDGIYMSFDEFKNNSPSIKDYELIENKNSREEGHYKLKYIVADSTGKNKTKVVRKCFGFSHKGILYFNNRNSGYYRMFIIGALSHILSYYRQDIGFGGYSAGLPVLYGSVHYFTEVLLDFETGEKFMFSYENFTDFLKTHDEEMLAELEGSKNKRELTHKFLLKYNEKHPIYFPIK